MYPDLDGREHSEVTITTFIFFQEIPFSGLCVLPELDKEDEKDDEDS